MRLLKSCNDDVANDLQGQRALKGQMCRVLLLVRLPERNRENHQAQPPVSTISEDRRLQAAD